MSVVPKDLITMAPELVAETNNRLQFFIDLATRSINAVEWDDRTDDGISLLACHYLTLANRGGSGGGVASESVGGLSVSYTSATDGGLLSQTSYGQLFFLLMRTLVTSPRVVS